MNYFERFQDRLVDFIFALFWLGFCNPWDFTQYCLIWHSSNKFYLLKVYLLISLQSLFAMEFMPRRLHFHVFLIEKITFVAGIPALHVMSNSYVLFGLRNL